AVGCQATATSEAASITNNDSAPETVAPDEALTAEGSAVTGSEVAGSPAPPEPVETLAPPALAPAPTPLAPPTGPPVVVLMIGDGMGDGQIATASQFRHGATGRLFMEHLPIRANHRTASLSGVTDSAASATTIATGVPTHNGYLGIGPGRESLESLVELAHGEGLATAVVTTSHVMHATPAAFLVEWPRRFEYPEIARQIAGAPVPDVLLGGGRRAMGDPDSDAPSHVQPMREAGRTVTRDIAAVVSAPAGRVVGLFSNSHLTYVHRGPADDEPSLREMSLAALERVASENRGAFVMIEGARIDHAGHGNLLEESIHETLAFDDAVAAVVEWARQQPNATVFVTADHETGGLELVDPRPAGIVPGASWHTGNHTNDDVPLLATGPCADVVDGRVTNHAVLYHVLRACVEGRTITELPDAPRILDGRLNDVEGVATGDARAASDRHGLWLGWRGELRPESAYLVLVDAVHVDAPAPSEWIFDIDPTTGSNAAGEPANMIDTFVHNNRMPSELADRPWDAFWLGLPGSLAWYDPYQPINGARRVDANGQILPLPGLYANVASPVMGRGVAGADDGIEWRLDHLPEIQLPYHALIVRAVPTESGWTDVEVLAGFELTDSVNELGIPQVRAIAPAP
ncbi:MAG: alkaline phosphatase, partial [Bradymonadia bacterium]